MNSKHILNNKKKAFTLIELLIVIAVIGILFIVIVSRVDFATDKAKTTGVQTDFRSFQMAFDTVARENGGFNAFGFNTGDNAGAIPAGYAFETEALRKATMGDGKRNSFDSGDKNLNGKKDPGEVWNGHKIHTEEWTEVYTLIKPGTSNYDSNAIIALENAINANLDPKLQISIAIDGTITMANQARDPWKNEYTGVYISNADNYDPLDRGAIVMFCAGADGLLHSEASISGGVVNITNAGNDKRGQDDYSIVSCYTFYNGYGEIKNMTTGFGANASWIGNIGSVPPAVIPGGNGGNAGSQVQGPGESGYTMLDMPNGTASLAEPLTFRSSADYNKLRHIKIDGNVVSTSNYYAKEGSTIITLCGSYVNTLSNGTHEIEIVSTDGSAKANFNVQIECRDHEDYWYDEYYDEYYSGDDSYCDNCGIVWCYWYGCMDDNGDCRCDWCGSDWYELHCDGDANSYCDNCNRVVGCLNGGGCLSDSGDCCCWYCGGYTHEDLNLDGYCDLCDRIYCSESGVCHPYAYGCFCEWCGNEIHHITEDSCYCTMCYYNWHCDDDYNGYCDRCNDVLGCQYGGNCIIPEGSCWCVWCDYAEHEGYENDGICNKCNSVDCYNTGVCGTTGNYCYCDACGEPFHKDQDMNCSCDNCSLTIHTDRTDPNSYCDNCGIVFCEHSNVCIPGDDCYCDWCNLPMHASVVNGYCSICGDFNTDGTSIDKSHVLTSGMSAIVNAGQYVYFKFTATESGTYRFYSIHDRQEHCDPYGYLLNGNGSQLSSDDDGNGNLDFSLSQYMNAGETVYVKVKLYNSSQSARFMVYVEQD